MLAPQTRHWRGGRSGDAGERRRGAARGHAPRALPQLRFELPPWLGGGQAGGGRKGGGDPLAAQREELLELLLGPTSGSGSSTKERPQARASQLVDELMAAGLPFDEARLGGGPWVVVYTRGAPQL
jgi:hypothetical protein